MRILLDECVPLLMRRLFTGHACSSVQDLGWGGIKNGELLQRAEGEFDLFITSDQNLRYQQILTGRRLAILELSTNDISRIQAARSLIETAIDKIQPDEFRQLTLSMKGCFTRLIRGALPSC
jgi:predicted nuclease of predicted toxin-antitoxin system